MNTIQTIETSNYSIFDSIQDKRKKGAQVQAVKYIKRLATVSNTDISEWDIVKVFGEDGMIATERNKINQLFFTYRDTAPKVKTPLHHATVTALTKIQEMRQFGNVANLEHQLKTTENYMNNSYREFQNQVRACAKIRQQIDITKGYKPNYPLQVAELVNEGFWKYVELDTTTGEITFETVNDIVLRDYNKTQGVKYSLNLGKFRLKFNVRTNMLKCYPWPQNFAVKMGQHPHPHVDYGGNICFGDLKPESQMALAGGDIKQIMDLVQRTITSFHSDSPYVQLSALKKLREEYVKKHGTQQEKEEMVAEAEAAREGRVQEDGPTSADGISQGPQPAQAREESDVEF